MYPVVSSYYYLLFTYLYGVKMANAWIKADLSHNSDAGLFHFFSSSNITDEADDAVATFLFLRTADLMMVA